MKGDSFQAFLEVPTRTGPIFELALGGPEAPRERLRSLGWQLRDPIDATRTPLTYEAFIRESKAEFGLAKHGYAVSRSGWFSERSICYLASGRPVLAQETGFSDGLPTGPGVLPFYDADDLCDAIDELNRNYEKHCQAGREVTEAYFDSRKVLPRLLELTLQSGA